MKVKSFLELNRNLKLPKYNFKKLRIAILADSSTQHLVKALNGYGIEMKFDLEIFEADYDQISMQVFNVSSELYSFQPEFILIYQSVQHVQKKYFNTISEAKSKFADNHISEINVWLDNLQFNSNAKIIYLNYPEIEDGIYGNFSNKLEESWLFQIRTINFSLMKLACTRAELHIADISILKSRLGAEFVFDQKLYIHADLAFSLDFLPYISKCVIDILLALTGRINKCLILDLDNTTWGGIIGDDGIEGIEIGSLGIGKAFSELQLWAKELKNRGIILAVCSKNTESVAMEPFIHHPEMILKLDDIAVFVANWDNKVDNIKFIQSVLNIGFDSMVFLDDNPFERDIVRTNIPDITVPELPLDPSEYISFLKSLNLFETASISNEDKNRTKQYKEEASRVVLKKTFLSEVEYLSNLNMEGRVKLFDTFSVPRIAQLSQRSNQFNLRTVRYTEADILKIIGNPNQIGLTLELSDKFGNYGLISVVILEKRENSFFIETWLMSCRVLKRSVENFMLNKIMDFAMKNNIESIIGEYLPTSKNDLVRNHYSDLGFDKKETLWFMDVKTFKDKVCYIQLIE